MLGVLKNSTQADTKAAVKAAEEAAPGWRDLDFDDRAAVLLKAADLLAGPWRQRINAATVLGQSKTAFQAEIDSACELIDFWRYNVHYAREILADQPIANSPGIWNRTDHRPLEGFVYAITPFNFTAIAGNLPTAPALMGNTVIWKPSPTQQLAASLTMELLEEAGMPPGVINMLPGDGLEVSKVALASPDLAGIHFTGSTPTFQHLWREVGNNIAELPLLPAHRRRDRRQGLHRRPPVGRPRRGAYRDDPRRVRVPGPEVLGRVARVRRPLGVEEDEGLARLRDRDHHRRRPDRLPQLHGRGHRRPGVRQAQGGDRPRQAPEEARHPGRRQARRLGRLLREPDRSSSRSDPTDEMFTTEYFGPILAVHVYEDADFEKVVRGMESIAPYALTGSIIAQDRRAIAWASHELRFAAGNFYINDKPTGAVVGQQPFGGGRAQRHQRQGRRRGEPAALDLAALDQGDVRPADRLPLPVPGLMTPLHLGALHPVEQALTLLLAFGPFVVLGVVILAPPAPGPAQAEEEPRLSATGSRARPCPRRAAPCGACRRSGPRSCRRPAGCSP